MTLDSYKFDKIKNSFFRCRHNFLIILVEPSAKMLIMAILLLHNQVVYINNAMM